MPGTICICYEIKVSGGTSGSLCRASAGEGLPRNPSPERQTWA